ncbi:E3 ubiquitin-protein ligase RNF213-like [Glandiceps talaboti]
MVTVLDRYRVDTPIVPRPEELADYLLNKFVAETNSAGKYVSGQVAAGNVTFNKSSVLATLSSRSGTGKSLFVKRLAEQLEVELHSTKPRQIPFCITVPLAEAAIDISAVLALLKQFMSKPEERTPAIFHIDISPLVQEGIDDLLFNLLVLRAITDAKGNVWRRSPWDLYVIEMNASSPKGKVVNANEDYKSFIELLPSVSCYAPKETEELERLLQDNELPENKERDPRLDDTEFKSLPFQQSLQYLLRYEGNENLDHFQYTPGSTEGNHLQCISTLLKYCGLNNPSWAELRYFTSFLGKQLEDCEQSVFCKPENLTDTELTGFKNFVVKFMIQMSKDFATPSLETDDQSSEQIGTNSEVDKEDISQFQLRRTWENSPHPYIFFNRDQVTMTFLGFNIDMSGNLIDPKDQRVLEMNFMQPKLRRGLQRQQVDFVPDEFGLTRDDMLDKLRRVLGSHGNDDPDPNYELTVDNVKKIMAIHMRFRCGIPVIIMGETGCGKTRLIRYMCELQAGKPVGKNTANGPENMLILKVHGGTTSKDIVDTVRTAVEKAKINRQNEIPDTVLFFDEANTTEAIGLIKEILCDGRMNGEMIDSVDGTLHFVAACNPYKRHTSEMVRRLEASGLGYYIKSDETEDRLGMLNRYSSKTLHHRFSTP